MANIDLGKSTLSGSSGSAGGLGSGFDLAIAEIEKFDGVTVSVDLKAKSLIKFGANDNLSTGVEQTVWLTGGKETYATTNSIDEIVSTAADTHVMRIEGHTISGSDLTFVVQTVTLNGITPVTLTTPLARVTRAENTSSTDLAGDVTVEDSTSGLTHLTILATENDNQSAKCATTISKDDYWLITSFLPTIDSASSGTEVVFKIRIRKEGGVFQTKFRKGVSVNGGSSQIDFEEPIIVRPNSDVEVTATATSNNTKVGASLHGQLALIV